MKKFLAVVIVLSFVFIGCQATAPTPIPTALPTVPPAPTATSIPPTSTAVPTLVPTDTPQPTPTPTITPTKEPPPPVSRELLVGNWYQFDLQAQGNNYLLFRENGDFQGRHGGVFPGGQLVSEGTWKLEKDELTITDNKDCPDGEFYRIKFTTKTHLYFTVLGTTCNNFAEGFNRQRNWDRVTDTQ